MKTNLDRETGVPSSAVRRKLLQAAAAGAGLSSLPGAALAANAISAVAPTLMVGYCSRQAYDAQSGSPALGDAFTVSPVRGTYELRVLGAGTSQPLALSAQYSSLAEHRFWQAWTENGLLQRSAPIAIRWASPGGNALPINIRLPSGTLTADITARAGVYVVAAVPSALRVPAWSTLTLKKQFSGGVECKLVSRPSGGEVAFPYTLFSVEPLVV